MTSAAIDIVRKWIADLRRRSVEPTVAAAHFALERARFAGAIELFSSILKMRTTSGPDALSRFGGGCAYR
jgi:hypothetical protein